MKYLLSFAFAGVLFAQEGAPIRISPAPVPEAYTTITHYTTGIPDYVCKARSTQNISTITVSAISNANTGVMTATSHGLYYATGVTQKIVAFISGLTGSWISLNGMHILVPASANTLTTDVDTTSFGAVTGTIVVSTRAPKVTASVWSVQAIVSDSSGNPTITAWTAPTTGTTLGQLTGGMTSFAFPCSAPSSYQ